MGTSSVFIVVMFARKHESGLSLGGPLKSTISSPSLNSKGGPCLRERQLAQYGVYLLAVNTTHLLLSLTVARCLAVSTASSDSMPISLSIASDFMDVTVAACSLECALL